MHIAPLSKNTWSNLTLCILNYDIIANLYLGLVLSLQKLYNILIFILRIASLRMAVWAAETCWRVPHIKSISLVYILVLLLLYHTCSITARIIDHPKLCVSLSLRSPNDYCSYSSWITCQCCRNAAPDWSLRLHVLDHFAWRLRQYCASCLCVWSGLVYADLCVGILVVSGTISRCTNVTTLTELETLKWFITCCHKAPSLHDTPKQQHYLRTSF